MEAVLSTYEYHGGSIQVEDKQNAEKRFNREITTKNMERKKERCRKIGVWL